MKNNDNFEPSCVMNGEEEEIVLPGFRFHPTDEELVGFYLRRKVDKKSLSIELIKQVDIYKFDPWDLPKGSGGADREGYFFCKRGRKYRNSIRPNRVTGSGFWKATGIDKPIYSSNNVGGGTRDHHCIGLKKTLVYYRGSAGKGSKTDWMMHEFRLPINETTSDNPKINSIPEAEVWTLCRIFKRNVSHRKYTPDWRELSNKRQQTATTTINMDTSSKTCSVDSNITRANYLNFSTPMIQYSDKKPLFNQMVIMNNENNFHLQQQLHEIPSMAASSSTISSPPYNGNEFFTYSGDWDELRSVVEFALDPSHL